MRIAIFAETFLPKWDGITNTLCHLLERLAARGHTSLMFAPAGAPDHYADTPIVGLPGVRFPLYPELKLALPGVDVMGHLQRFRPDIIHVASPVSLGIAGLKAARALGVPVLTSYHTDVPGYARRYGVGGLEQPLWRYFRWLHNQADMTLCPSRFTQAQLEKHGFSNVQIWGRGVDAELFNPGRRSDVWRRILGFCAADGSEAGGESAGPLLLYAGRLAVEKRVDWLRPVMDALPWARLAIVGDGPMRGRLEELFAGTHTVFTGYMQGADLASAYAAADMFVLPSANETFGNVVLEAMASGLPVIAARAGGPVDHVDHGRTGLLFNPDSPADLLAKVRRVALSGDYGRRLGAAARAYACTQTWETALDWLLDDYATLLARRSAGQRALQPGSVGVGDAAPAPKSGATQRRLTGQGI